MKILLFAFAFLLVCVARNAGANQPDLHLARSVVKVVARSADGKNSLGSGVIIADNKVATNCHVSRSGTKITILKAGRRFSVKSQAALPDYDVCLLETRGMQLPVAPLGNTEQLRTGDSISIYGYPYALGIRYLIGSIVAVHDHASKPVIEIDAGFMQGASGGGLFNDSGKLIGLITFIGSGENRKHFYAIPVDWLREVLKLPMQPVTPFTETSFWEEGRFGHLLR